ncbi:hypothetical protein EDI_338260 [Entamoeba dispar SAW760]|uniref:Uncharacterized protein n=1 Tax=Entamoeba dispar (strain ATCC PRA-260 / SAW760) TaxID=370354 RepID=B0EA86_ENTDS|nr:uncharacterized protein EDI_338260 [Entamoeba dispar SAW760]EDR28573.1 hypothetical protein EDI_338260 [Entamoeba dispar SAW760]|eukprot:EDR28573.1 hypothetical protein EDI_338260 [Entamoeba dispar SAW760]
MQLNTLSNQHESILKVRNAIKLNDQNKIEDSLNYLFTNELNLTDKELEKLFIFLVQNIDKLLDIVVYNAEILVVLHSLCCTSIKTSVSPFLDSIYINASPRDLFLIHTSLINYTDNINTLLHSLTYLPSILERIPKQRLEKSLKDTYKNIEQIMNLINETNEKKNEKIIQNITESFIKILQPSKETLYIILLLIKNQILNNSLITKIKTFCINCTNLPNIILSFNFQQLLTYIGFELPIPLILNTSKIYHMIEDAIKHCNLFSQHSIIILQYLMNYNQNTLDIDVISILHNSITSIQTNDILQQRQAAQLFQLYILSHNSESIKNLIIKVFDTIKYRHLWSYILHIIRLFISFSFNNPKLPCFNNPSLVFSEIDGIINKLLNNNEYMSLDKFGVIGIIDELVDVVSFIHFISKYPIIPFKITDYINKLNQILSNLLNVRSLILNGLTHEDKEQLKKANKICNITSGNEKIELDIDGGLERNTTRIEFGIFSLQKTIKSLQSKIN